MDVRCEKCSTEYEFDEERVGANGVTVKCTACGFVFKVRRPRPAAPPRATTTLGKGPQGREWLVRKPDAQMIAFRELTTLQKWIVEGRIARDDEISKNGETWKRLGNILELEPFFSVYEKARALNELIERGGVDGSPVELRGSEVLATMNPLSSLPLDDAGTQPPARPRASLTPAFSTPVVPPGFIQLAADRSQPGSGGGLVSSTIPIPLSGAGPRGASAIAGGRTLSGPMDTPPPLPGGASPSFAARGARGTGDLLPGSSVPGLIPASTPYPPAGGPGITPVLGALPALPGALDAPARSPAGQSPGAGASAWPRAPLGIPLDDLGARELERATAGGEGRAGSRRALLWAGVVVALGALGGVALAALGPAGNPLQVLGERLGLRSPRIVDDGASRFLEEAQRAFDLDALASLERAEGLFEQAERLRPNDPAVRGDRALVMVTRAEALRRAAAELGAAADEADRARAAWQAQLKVVEAENAKPGARPSPLPAAPSGPDPAALRADLARESERASAALKQAFDLAAAAYKAAPEAFEPARALAEYYRVQQDQTSYARERERARRMLERTGALDAALLHGEAVALATPPRGSAEERAKSMKLLEQALTTRPSMNRARVQLARLRLAEDAPELAARELERVLSGAPDHAEAKRLAEQAARRLEAKTAKPTLEPAEPATPAKTTPAEPAKAGPAEPAKTTPAEPAKAGPVDRATQDLKNGAKFNFDNLMNAGDRLRERDQPKAALASYEKAADLKPGSAEPLTGMGWAYLDLEKAEAALSMFKRALKANDRYADAYYGAAEAHRALGHKDEAIQMYEQYLSRSPSGTDRPAAQRALERLKQ